MMKFRLRYKHLMIVMMTLLAMVAAFLFASPVNADNTVTTANETPVTNQPNAPNPQSRSSLTAENAQSINQPASASINDEANANKSATTAADSANDNLSVAKENDTKQESQLTTSDAKQVTPSSSTVDIVNGSTNQPLKTGDQIDQYTPLKINMSYDFSGTNVNTGDYFTISVPDELRITGGTVINTDYGTATFTGNTGQFVFNTDGSDAQVELHFTAQIDDQNTKENSDVPITVKVNNHDLLSIVVHYVPGTVSPTERFSKYTMNDDLSKDNIKYAIRINPAGDVTYKDAIIADHLQTPGFTYDPSSFEVRKVTWTWNGSNWDNQTLEQLSAIKPVFNADMTSFTISLGNQVLANSSHEGFLILYAVLYNGKPVNQRENIADRPADGTVIRNVATLESSNNAPIDYPQTLQIKNSGGQSTVRFFTLDLTKVDDSGNRLKGATFQLISQADNRVIATVTTDDNGEAEFTKLLRGNYLLREVAAPAGYQAASDLAINVNEFKDNHLVISKTIIDQKLISIPVQKVWDDNNDQDGLRPQNITVTLLANGEVVRTVTLSAANDWKGSADNLVQKANGQDIVYTWREVNVPAGYQAAVDGNTITNTHVPATISKSVTKQWVDNDNQDGLRPSSITINLLANGKFVQNVELNSTNKWTATIKGLPKKAAGKDITYSWEEVKVPGYQTKVDGDTIINVHTPVTISKTVAKQWDDNDDQDGLRPGSITVNLLANDKVIRVIELNAANGWTATINDLAQKANGQDITYTWQEAAVPAGYQATVNGDTIINTHIPATISKSVTKQWADNDNQDGLRPDSITINLLANGKFVQAVKLNAANHWTATIDNLAQKANGQEIVYTWQEAAVPTGYQAEVNGDVITNTHVPATISKAVTKQWVDNDNQDGLRPGSIKVNLLANGNVVRTVTLNDDNHWTATLNGLAQKANGQVITYTWQEANVPAGYQAAVTGDTIVNTHIPATISKSVTKQWADNNNQDGLRPGSITVNLLANGKTVRTIELNAVNGWTVMINDLAQKANGQVITYAWQEANVPAGYQAAVTGDTITNTHVPVTISKSVTKQWDDGDNQDGLRPDSIKVNLLANGKVIQTVELSATNNWTATVNNLAQKSNGQDIVYAWQEANVPAGYQATVAGDTITNTHVPATISKTVTKRWVDNDNQDGLRPGLIKVDLLANGKVIRTIELNTANGWTTTVADLAQKANGQDITYTWQEVTVPTGYQATVAGDTITNTHIPATISKTVTKQWNDSDNQDGLRPGSIKVNLLANGKVIQTIELNAANDWNATLNDLAQKSNGQVITYTWQEADVPTGYRAEVNGDVITNTHTPATISKAVTKQWTDNDNQDGLRPSSIKVNLLANGKVIRTVELNAANNWTATVDGLAQKSHGQDIVYAWQEAEVPTGYQATVNGDTITNTHVPVTISKSVTKQWDDGDNQDGLRPGSIEVNLLANGNVIQTIELNAANNWTATVDDLAQKSNGQDIAYTWQEANVPTSYQATVAGDTITNTHIPATISKTVTKQWVDNDNQDGLRPDSIKVNLLANGKVIRTVELTAANDWTATINDLAQKANGQDITYTWQEANVPSGYESVVNGDVITNTHAPLTTKTTVTKVWNDADNQDGLRPNSVTINLLANGRGIRTAVLSAANGWHAEFDDLMMYSHQGQRIVYTVEEADVPNGYQSAVEQNGMDFTVTNTHQPTTPTTPDEPKTPTTPVTPEQPTTPTEPTTPVTPVVPGQPSTPVYPVQPVHPAQPAQTTGQGESQLPQTGNGDSLALIVLGLVLMSLTMYVGKRQ